MKRWKTRIASLLFPPGWVVVTAFAAGYGGLFWMFAKDCTGPLASAEYLLSAYALVIDIAALPGIWASLKSGQPILKSTAGCWRCCAKLPLAEAI